MDDVLNNLMKEWFEKCYLKSQNSCITYKNITENPPHKILGLTLHEYQKSLDKFRSESYLLLKPIHEVSIWFKRYGHLYQHIVLTSVPLKFAHLSAQWVFKNFGTWIRSFNIVPTKRLDLEAPQYHKSKVEFLDWFDKGDLLIDDNIKNIEKIKIKNLKTLLFPRPWNNSRMSVKETLERINDFLI